MKRIILTGFRGSGKSTVGKILSKRLKTAFADTDLEIEKKAGMDIPGIFSEYGEEEFRRLERETIRELPEKDCVISTGGGAVTDYLNSEHLRRDSYVIFLNIDPETAFLRISGSDRPALTSKEPEDEIHDLIKERYPAYVRTSDFCIDAAGDPDDICDEISAILFPGKEAADKRESAIKNIFCDVSMPEGKKDELISFLKHNPAGNLCAIAGNPCIHSKSPAIYNSLFDRYKIPAHYTYLGKNSAQETVDAFRASKMRGLSVTIPYKEEIIPFLDSIDKHAEKLGAVNTVVNSCGMLSGYNTDWYGVKRPLEEAGIKTKGKTAAVLGAGGAARGAVYALIQSGMDVFVLNRTEERAKVLSEEMGCGYGSPGDLREIKPDLLINATPVGMKGTDTPVEDKSIFKKEMTVFDIVYTPPLTRLLKEAEEAGCRVISGEEMFIHQAAEQFYLMFGIRVNTAEIRRILG